MRTLANEDPCLHYPPESNTPYLIVRLCMYMTSVLLYLVTTVIDEEEPRYNIWVCEGGIVTSYH